MRKRLTKAKHDGLKEVGRKVMLTARTNARMKDHSLADLARMDHPYAKRHQFLSLFHTGKAEMRDTRQAIHTRTGALASSIQGRYVRPDSTFTVFFDLNKAPHALWVIQGTKVMLQRDLLVETALGLAPELNKILASHYTAAIKDANE